MGTHKIRTTINPGEVLTVDDAGLLEHERLGLVLSDAKVGKVEAAEKKAAEKAEASAPADDKKKGA